jgi:type IV pilus assembly protein PilX
MHNEKGVALLTSLIFLVVLTILGLAGMRSTTMQERMSGNLRDQSVATQAAEAALRDARADLTYGAHGNTRSITAGSFPLPADDTCSAGLCGTNDASNFLAETDGFWDCRQ